MRKNIPVYIYLITILILILVCLLSMVLVYDYTKGKQISGRYGKYLSHIARVPQKWFQEKTKPQNTLTTSDRFPGKDIFFKDKDFTDTGYLFISSYDKRAGQTIIKLIKLSDGSTIHSWKPDLEKIKSIARPITAHFKPEKLQQEQFRTVHPILLEDLTILIKGEYGIYKLDSNSKILWHKAGHYHHSTEADGMGNFWIASVCEPSALENKLLKKIEDDAVVKIDAAGNILFKKSIAQMLIENGYAYLICGIGPLEKDAIHVNDIEPVKYSSSYWSVGDIFINIRNRSTVFLYRPSTNKILWLKTGPWINQHDISILSDCKIMLIDNHAARINENDVELIENRSYIFNYDFSKDTCYTVFNKFMTDNNIQVLKEGRALQVADGDIVLEESVYGRILRGNDNALRWRFINKQKDGKVSTIQWSRYYSTIPTSKRH
eukprot:GDKJ01058472.1.p2 GENE.GDKJ01058472.1~~GDKJ01058472.1.p2  ORF type:complete len:434 (-),score=-17.81 GDKJ01058472.1:2014-3315(-)